MEQSVFFRVDFEGRWYGPDGKEVNEASLYFLSQNIRTDEQGYFIALGYGPVKLVVEDVPFVIMDVRRVEGAEPATLELTLPGGAIEPLVPESLSKKGEHYYCRVKSGNIPARFGEGPKRELLKYLTFEGEDIFLTL